LLSLLHALTCFALVPLAADHTEGSQTPQNANPFGTEAQFEDDSFKKG
jgi:hypothetical protein